LIAIVEHCVVELSVGLEGFALGRFELLLFRGGCYRLFAFERGDAIVRGPQIVLQFFRGLVDRALLPGWPARRFALLAFLLFFFFFLFALLLGRFPPAPRRTQRRF
jgi:hypothetical protein